MLFSVPWMKHLLNNQCHCVPFQSDSVLSRADNLNEDLTFNSLGMHLEVELLDHNTIQLLILREADILLFITAAPMDNGQLTIAPGI